MMVYWRFKRAAPCEWRFGFMTPAKAGLYRMGFWNGDTQHGPIVDLAEIETREIR